MNAAYEFRVVFFCMGNICRSPTAHGVFRHRLQARGLHDRVAVSSAGTHAYHIGEAPDARSQHHARLRGYDLADLRARQLAPADFEHADLLLAMDWDNLALAEAQCPPEYRHKLRRLTEFCRRHDSPVVPDPYFGGPDDFERVLDLVEDACDGLLDHIERVLATRRLLRP
ncbi:MAG: low molecular weight protein-tyrosine-phosphatase [Tepidimonas sp.]|uniref:low molecular weight protein-tyrosine-phosphatase n=1 Tax=Tepidimonas sp. TaxID=2002775 RepID=UPI004054EC71